VQVKEVTARPKRKSQEKREEHGEVSSIADQAAPEPPHHLTHPQK